MIVPDFLVIGAYKSGTTALHHQLRSHPELYLPPRKEPSFFAFDDSRPPVAHPAAASSVRQRSAYDALFADAPGGARLGEVSPAYMAVPGTWAHIQAAAPEVRLVAVLRNPVERAYSDYLMYRRDGIEKEADFLSALVQQARRDQATDPTSRYLSTGLYAEQLEPYLSAFPRHQVHVLLHDDLRARPEATLRAVFAFLGVSSDAPIGFSEEVNVSGEPTSTAVRLAYKARRRLGQTLRPIVPESLKRRADSLLQRGLVQPPLPDDARAFLAEAYRADVARLAVLLERDLAEWRLG